MYSKINQYRTGDSDFGMCSYFQTQKNKPNRMVKVYRAIPDNFDCKRSVQINYKKKMNWMKEKKIPADATPKILVCSLSEIETQHEHELRNEPRRKTVKINTDGFHHKKYAMDHGRDNLGSGNFK